MSDYGVVLLLVGSVLASVALCGLAVQRRVRASYSFALYLLTVSAGRVLLLVAPEHFWTWPFMFWTDALQTLLCAAIAFEICAKVFRPLPGGRVYVRRLIGLVVVARVLTFVILPPHASDAFEGTFVVAQVSYAVAFLFGAFLLVTWYGGVPVDPLHRDVVCGFVVLSGLVAYTGELSALDPGTAWGRDLLTKSAYPLLLLFWCWSAWRRDEPTRLSPRSLALLQPWRVTS